MSSGKSFRQNFPGSVRLILAVLVMAGCVWGFLSAWRAGASRKLTHPARAARLLQQGEGAIKMAAGDAEDAVRLAADDPEAHTARALALLNRAGPAIALAEYERAVSLRPRDYFLWLELGQARDMADDEEGALAALSQAVKLAPEYAQPRWQLGNVLFRAGRAEEAFAELRRAAASDVTLLPNLIDLAWNATGRDSASTIELINPEKTSWRIELARFFARQGRGADAVAQFRGAGQFPEKERRALLTDLLARKSYREAYQIWAADEAGGKRDQVNDGGFEGKLTHDNPGFGWQLIRDTQAIRLSIERNSPHSGAQSLRMDFNGDSNPNQPILTQLILVEPGTRYQLRFAARGEKIVTGGKPILSVSDAGSLDGRTLAQSPPLDTDADGWREYTVDFSTGEATDAVLISFHRQPCGEGPCPIFGRIWLDDFSLQKNTQ